MADFRDKALKFRVDFWVASEGVTFGGAEKPLELTFVQDLRDIFWEAETVMRSTGGGANYVLQDKPHCGSPVYRDVDRKERLSVENVGK